MSTTATAPSWMEGVAEAKENGYLTLLISDPTVDADDDDKKTKLRVLNATESLLHILNSPPTPVVGKKRAAAAAAAAAAATLEQQSKVTDGVPTDNPDDGENLTNDVDEGCDDASYNHLVRIRNLFDTIQAALGDIQKMKQRDEKGEKKKGGRHWSRDANRLKSLEHRQTRLQEHSQQQLSEQQPQQMQQEESEQQATDALEELGDGLENLNMDDTKSCQSKQEPLIRWVLTLNSIRALFPVLLPMLNHERRNDVKLKICSYKLAVSAQGSKAISKQCWLIGQHVFDVTSQKACKKLHDDMCGILESFVRDPQVVQQVMTTKSRDEEFQTQFWTNQWLEWVARETTIRPVPHPLHRLVEHSTLPMQTILEFAQKCDQEFIIEPLALMGHQGSSEVQDRYVAAITTLHTKLSQLLTSRFRGARLSLYGSCMSNLSLGQSSDVDLSLYIPLAESTQRDFDEGRMTPAKYESQMKSLVFQVCRKLESVKNTFRDMQPVARARVPVVSGSFLHAGNPHSPDGSIKFDICFMNDIAVANSSLLHQYSLVDPRARALMLIVKKWTQDYEINSAKNRCISSYAWMNMVVFYLQTIGMLPNLQCPHLTAAVGIEPDPYWHSINKLKTAFLKWQDVDAKGAWKPTLEPDVPVTALLHGFFRFYASDFPWSTYCISIRSGGTNLSIKSVFRNTTLDFFSIEDPFETYDAYCPHDLSSPASELGQKKILDLLRDAESYLRNVLVTAEVDKEVAGLWKKPIHAVAVAPSQNDGGKQTRQRNRGKDRNDRPANEQKEQPEDQGTQQRNGQVAPVETQHQRSKQPPQTSHVNPRHGQPKARHETKGLVNEHAPHGNSQRARPPKNHGRNDHLHSSRNEHRPRNEERSGSQAGHVETHSLEQHPPQVAVVQEPPSDTLSGEVHAKVEEAEHQPTMVNGFSKPPPKFNTGGRTGDSRRHRPGGRNMNPQQGKRNNRPKNAKPKGSPNGGDGAHEAATHQKQPESH